MDAAAYVGRLMVLDDVGFIPCPFKTDLQWTMPPEFRGFPPRRLVSTHKGTFGHLAIVAGSRGFHGASVLAAHGAQRARPGLITLFTQPDTYAPVAAQLQAVMVRLWDPEPGFEEYTAILFGPGLAAQDVPSTVADAVRQAWLEFNGPVVVDASALAWLPSGSFPECAVRVITPHPGEAARLLGVSAAEVQADRIAAVRALSIKFGDCWVVLKGHQTLVGRADDVVYVNCSGGPAMAQGGSGDLLAGYLAGWLAQPLLRTEPLQSIRYAVWEHGAAADRLDVIRPNWIVDDFTAELGRVPA
jgi:NAD(P)H-hydrate epimerase